MVKRTFRRVATFHVYILCCADGTYYTGSTNDLSARLKLHHAGNGAKYVRGRGPLELVYAKAYRYYKLAFKEEKRIQGLTKMQKDKLIREHATRAVSKRSNRFRRALKAVNRRHAKTLKALAE